MTNWRYIVRDKFGLRYIVSHKFQCQNPSRRSNRVSAVLAPASRRAGELSASVGRWFVQCIYRTYIQVKFDWDVEKAEENFLRHGIDFEEAIRIFEGVTVEDEDSRHDYGEIRVRAIGALGSRLITVIYTMRRDVCRVISARHASKNEKKAYRHGQRR